MSSEGKSCAQQSTLLSSSLCSRSCILMPVSEKPGNIKLTSSEPGCYCSKSIRERPKLCQTYIDFITPKPITFSVAPCDCEDEAPVAPTCVSEEEGTHEHKYCHTPDCIHNSQGVHPSYEDYEACPTSCTGACSSQSPVVKSWKPLYVDPHLKDHVPKSIEELKASISGLEKFPLGNLLGCEFTEFHCELSSAGPACEPKDSNTSLPDRSDNRLMQGISLTMEPNDHRFCKDPNNCKHTRDCVPAPSPPTECPPEPCPPEPCPPEPCPPEPCPPVPSSPASCPPEEELCSVPPIDCSGCNPP